MRADLTERPIAVLGVAILHEAIQFGIDVGELTEVEIAMDHVYTFVTLMCWIVKFKRKKNPRSKFRGVFAKTWKNHCGRRLRMMHSQTSPPISAGSTTKAVGQLRSSTGVCVCVFMMLAPEATRAAGRHPPRVATIGHDLR